MTSSVNSHLSRDSHSSGSPDSSRPAVLLAEGVGTSLSGGLARRSRGRIARANSSPEHGVLDPPVKFKLGVCAMAKKASSKPMQQILQRMTSFNEFEVVMFGDKNILELPVDQWPVCDCLLSWHSDGFPLVKAQEYVSLRHPFCVNDVLQQELLLDRRKVYNTLRANGIPVPQHIIVNRQTSAHGQVDDEGRPVMDDPPGFIEDHDFVELDGVRIYKPFVEKPVSGEDHNINIYYPSHHGGGVKCLFRKVGDKSADYDANHPGNVRRDGSYIYEEFLTTGGTDVKVYTVGPRYAHAEARKSPVVDGKVLRTADGKEMRYPVLLSPQEKEIARMVVLAFGQKVCGFDLLRSEKGKSYVCDVNGWSFVKNSTKYYDDAAGILRSMILTALAPQRVMTMPMLLPAPIPVIEEHQEDMDRADVVKAVASLQDLTLAEEDEDFNPQEELRCVLAVVRHGDRTPKQKIKMRITQPTLLALFDKHRNAKGDQAKLKNPQQLQELLGVVRELMDSLDAAIAATAPGLGNGTSTPPADGHTTEAASVEPAGLPKLPLDLGDLKDHESLEEFRNRLNIVRTVLEQGGGHFSGVNRKVQMKPIRWHSQLPHTQPSTSNMVNGLSAQSSTTSLTSVASQQVEGSKTTSPDQQGRPGASSTSNLRASGLQSPTAHSAASVQPAAPPTVVPAMAPTTVPAMAPTVVPAMVPTVVDLQPPAAAANAGDTTPTLTLHPVATQPNLTPLLAQITTPAQVTTQPAQTGAGAQRHSHSRLSGVSPRPGSAGGSAPGAPMLAEALLVVKWGGVLTHAGRKQAEHLGMQFRASMYPRHGPAGGGLLRLHSTYRHDLKIYSSDEGRVQVSAAAFTKGLLDLEGNSLTPILVSLVNKDASMLEAFGKGASEEMQACKDVLQAQLTYDPQKGPRPLIPTNLLLLNRLSSSSAALSPIPSPSPYQGPHAHPPAPGTTTTSRLLGPAGTATPGGGAPGWASPAVASGAGVPGDWDASNMASPAHPSTATGLQPDALPDLALGVQKALQQRQQEEVEDAVGALPGVAPGTASSSTPEGTASSLPGTSSIEDGQAGGLEGAFAPFLEQLMQMPQQPLQLLHELRRMMQQLVLQLQQLCKVPYDYIPTQASARSSSMLQRGYNSQSQAPEEWELVAGQPCGGERCVLLFDRWRKLLDALFNEKKGVFDISKIPDIYDSVKHDAIHNAHLGLPLKDMYQVAEALADVVIPNEYGLEPLGKLSVGSKIAKELVGKLLADMSNMKMESESTAIEGDDGRVVGSGDDVYGAGDTMATEFGRHCLDDDRMRNRFGNLSAVTTPWQPGLAGGDVAPATPGLSRTPAPAAAVTTEGAAAVTTEGAAGGEDQEDGDEEEGPAGAAVDDLEDRARHRLCPTYASDINSPLRHVRTRIYFTSESHIHSLMNVLRFCHMRPGYNGAPLVSQQGQQLLDNTHEMDYLTHIVFKMYENMSVPVGDPRRFRVQVSFSPGAAHNPFVLRPPDHTLPVVPLTDLNTDTAQTFNELQSLLAPFAVARKVNPATYALSVAIKAPSEPLSRKTSYGQPGTNTLTPGMTPPQPLNPALMPPTPLQPNMLPPPYPHSGPQSRASVACGLSKHAEQESHVSSPSMAPSSSVSSGLGAASPPAYISQALGSIHSQSTASGMHSMQSEAQNTVASVVSAPGCFNHPDAADGGVGGAAGSGMPGIPLDHLARLASAPMLGRRPVASNPVDVPGTVTEQDE